MDRRSLVSLLGAVGIGGTTGCIRRIDSRITDPGDRTVALVAQDEVGETHHLDIQVEMVEPTISSSQTARIRVTTANRGGKRALSVGSAPLCDIFNRADGGSDDPRACGSNQPGRPITSVGSPADGFVTDRRTNHGGFPRLPVVRKGTSKTNRLLPSTRFGTIIR